MSDAARQNLKVSREGIVLIKSFEGFRPRAVQRAEGGWVIGYGHTLSAREGATVSEADAELLLRYDLLPVEKTLNETLALNLNQHQFDALVSFAFSVGVDRFAGSDVRQRLSAGAPGEAADAIMGWPGPALPDIALRRRTAERALFVADPDAPVALADLLTAPLAPPAVIVPFQSPPVGEPEKSDLAPDAAAAATPVDPRGAAVAALLGEPQDRLVQDDAHPVETAPALSASNDAEPEPAAEAPAAEPADTAPEAGVHGPASDGPATEDGEPVDPAQAPTPPADAASLSATRYAPYALAMVGPLPYLQPATPLQPTAATADAPIDPSVVETGPAPGDDATRVDSGAPVDPAPAAELVLTPPDDAPEPAVARPLWTPEQRDDDDASGGALFGEDLTLTQGGGAILRHEIETEAPARFDWSETGPFIFMGGLGLVSFGAAMAAFRRAAEQSGGGELTLIGWVLALIGLGCVGVSAVNLYRKFGLPGGD